MRLCFCSRDRGGFRSVAGKIEGLSTWVAMERKREKDGHGCCLNLDRDRSNPAGRGGCLRALWMWS